AEIVCNPTGSRADTQRGVAVISKASVTEIEMLTADVTGERREGERMRCSVERVRKAARERIVRSNSACWTTADLSKVSAAEIVTADDLSGSSRRSDRSDGKRRR